MSNNHITKSPNRSQGLQLEPFAVRPRVAAQLDGCCITELYKRLNNNEYETYLDGAARMITVRSIRARQERIFANQQHKKPSKRPGRPDRPKKTAASS
jgi:hypothetical protein